jgi:hypothetical protein
MTPPQSSRTRARKTSPLREKEANTIPALEEGRKNAMTVWNGWSPTYRRGPDVDRVDEDRHVYRLQRPTGPGGRPLEHSVGGPKDRALIETPYTSAK